ncbi:MAG: hypothetical protein J6K39_01420 [Clostridia bacterium]|nr:hypothetical protein [Clostridia bacterium]
MKKLIVFMFLLCCFVGTIFFKDEKNPFFSIDGIEKVCFAANEKIGCFDVEGVHCGDLVFNFCSIETAKSNLSELKKQSKSMQLYFQGGDVHQLLDSLKAEIVSTSEHEGLMVFNCYTPYEQSCVYVENKKVNLQIAVEGEKIVAGFPVILTGF